MDGFTSNVLFLCTGNSARLNEIGRMEGSTLKPGKAS
jgi:hypothetical protein